MPPRLADEIAHTGARHHTKQSILILLSAFAFLLLTIPAVGAQTLTLQLSSSTLTFAVTGPPSKMDVPAVETPVSANVTYSGAGTVHIFMISNGDIMSVDGGPSLPASDVYWKATGSGYESGTLSSGEQVEAASGDLSKNSTDGWQFYLKKGPYPAGNYSVSITVFATAE